jgi:uncharacterized LabA/DUF88 family protein
MKTDRTIAYIDGFNLYFGLRAKGWRCYYWLNLWRLCHSLTQGNQQLVHVKYFTSRVKSPDDKRRRQAAYLRALGMTNEIERIYGKYIDEPHTCPQCAHEFIEPAEKMTDVQLASHFLLDAFKDNFDTAMIISGDSDLVPAIEICKSEFNSKRVVVVFPPMRYCGDLKNVAHAFYHITEKELKNSMFPPKVTDKLGNVVTCPTEWV